MNYNKLIPLCLLLATIFMGIGFALKTEELDINGTLITLAKEDIFISDISVDDNSSQVNDYYKTNFNITTVLSDESSDVTYTITLYNSTKNNYMFDDIYYDENFYDNSNIVYEIIGLEKFDVIKPKDTITFKVRFKYDHYDEDISNTLNAFMSIGLKRAYEITYSGFVDTNGFSKYIMENNSYSLSYLLEENRLFDIYSGNDILGKEEYSYENGKLFINSVNSDLKIVLAYKNLLANYEVLGDFEGCGITITSQGDGKYTINGTTTSEAFIRISDYFFITPNKNELVSAEHPSKKVLLSKGKYYQLSFNQISGSMSINSNNHARLVLRTLNSTAAYSNLGYDFVTEIYGKEYSVLENDIGMFSLYLKPDASFDNYTFQISVKEKDFVPNGAKDFGLPNYVMNICNDAKMSFYDNYDVIEISGLISSECYVDFTNRTFTAGRPDTSLLPIRYNEGDKVRITYNYIANKPSSKLEIAFPFRTQDVDSLALNDLKITTLYNDLTSDVVKEGILTSDATILSMYIKSGIAFDRYQFKIKVEKLDD